MAYEQIKIFIGKDGHQLPPWQKLICGSLAGFLSQSAIYPLEVLKTRLALRKTGQYSSMFDCVRKIYKFEGMKAFYKGYFINTIGILPAAGVVSDFDILMTAYFELIGGYFPLRIWLCMKR
jgi:solute carrier family 25 phosphate transporter 23/24/25/41